MTRTRGGALGRRTHDSEPGRDVRRNAPGGVQLQGQARQAADAGAGLRRGGAGVPRRAMLHGSTWPRRTRDTAALRTRRSMTNSNRTRRRWPPSRRPRRARGRGGSRATATPPWWGPEVWPVPRSAPSSAASVATSPSTPQRRTPWPRHLTGQPPAAAANQADEARVDGERPVGGDGRVLHVAVGPTDPGRRRRCSG